MAIPLEDNFADVISKAQRGLGISDSQLAERAGISVDAVRTVRNGDLSGDAVDRVAPILKLSAPALRKLAAGDWSPETIADIDGLAMFNTTYGDMTVNAYLVWHPTTRDAVAFITIGNALVAALYQGGQFKSEVLNTDASYSFTFTTPGTYDYLCSIHPFMTATVVVTA